MSDLVYAIVQLVELLVFIVWAFFMLHAAEAALSEIGWALALAGVLLLLGLRSALFAEHQRRE